MAEDTSHEDAPKESAEAPAKEPADASTPAAEGEAKAEAAPAATAVESEAKVTDPEAEAEGLDPQLIALCVVLWIGALGLFMFKWPSLRADWYLGDIMESISLRGDFDAEAMDQLVAMGPSVVPHLREEVYGANFNRDERYRIAVVKILEEIEGPEALDVLKYTSADVDARVRANTYISLKNRALAHADERGFVVAVLTAMAGQEPEPVALSYALQSLDELEGLGEVETLPLIWRQLVTLRMARPEGELPSQLRAGALKGLRLLSEQDEDALPFDNEADPETRDQQLKAWEAWYIEVGGEIPEGQDDWETWKAKVDEAASSDQADGSDDAPATDEPGAPAAEESE